MRGRFPLPTEIPQVFFLLVRGKKPKPQGRLHRLSGERKTSSKKKGGGKKPERKNQNTQKKKFRKKKKDSNVTPGKGMVSHKKSLGSPRSGNQKHPRGGGELG